MFTQVLVIWHVLFLCVIADMRRQGQGELLPFNPEPERIAHLLRREQREVHKRNLAVMKNRKGQIMTKSKTSHKGDRMGIMVGIMLPGRLYNQVILLCC